MRLYRLSASALIWIPIQDGVLLKCEPAMIRSLKAFSILKDDVVELPNSLGWYVAETARDCIERLSAAGIVISYIHDQEVDFGLF